MKLLRMWQKPGTKTEKQVPVFTPGNYEHLGTVIYILQIYTWILFLVMTE